MGYTLVNNFEKMKKAFTKEVGEDPEKEKELYLQYFQAKTLNESAQVLHFILEEIHQLKEEIKAIKINKD